QMFWKRIWGFYQFHSGRLILVGIIRFIHVEASMILKNGLGTLFARMSVIASNNAIIVLNCMSVSIFCAIFQ
ncbi:hypothetical protein, partial [Thiolapillus sp.]|uniref:hypothetical protein n=1 Tax=Thiolapillus sp. TaxID=2017437 RepID=UPI003AF8E7C1